LIHRIILPRLGIAIGTDKEVNQSVSRKNKSDD
jgi:hypothetical protein